MKYTKELHDNFRSSIDSNNIADNPFWAKVTALLDEIDRQAAEIAELKAGHQWIPVSERLPEEGQSVILYDRVLSGCEVATYHKGIWYLFEQNQNLYDTKDIYTHWMPLPLAPESEGE